MNDKKFQTIIDCGFSKIRAGAFNKEGKSNPFFTESNFYTCLLYTSDAADE